MKLLPSTVYYIEVIRNVLYILLIKNTGKPVPFNFEIGIANYPNTACTSSEFGGRYEWVEPIMTCTDYDWILSEAI